VSQEELSVENSLPAPLIGITSARISSKYDYSLMAVAEAYTAALAKAGANPVLLPLGLPDENLCELIARLDGVLFSGGGDIHPQRYAGQAHPQVNTVDEDRDRVEVQILHDCLQLEKPFLGICRGLQVINVAMGGDLYEDLQDQRPGSLKHDCFPEKRRDYHAHTASLAEGSRLGAILQAASVPVNSLHHQGIKRLADGLRLSALAPDGLVEGLELPNFPFGMAVQWHPEWLPRQAEMQALFSAFTAAAANHSQRNKP
jgi:putative glutamine amidotransferase